jgi:hypothetical protein
MLAPVIQTSGRDSGVSQPLLHLRHSRFVVQGIGGRDGANRVKTSWLMGPFGECQMMAQPAATGWLMSPTMHQDVVVPGGMIPFPEMAGNGPGPRLVVVGETPRGSLSPHR